MKRPLQQTPEQPWQRVVRRAGWLVRDRFPARPVVREVQGVRMTLPWSHRLPDYARWGTEYGQNLVRLAGLLAADQAPVTVLDVGANVGDSALQILHAADARVLCVEADEFYLRFLDLNTGTDPRVSVEAALLVADASVEGAVAAVRSGGTTRFEAASPAPSAATSGSAGPRQVSVSALRAAYSDFDDLRLAKSDTDGHDVVLVPEIARVWADRRPVLFTEYDPYFTRAVGNDPHGVWGELADLGYTEAGIWDNGGYAVARCDVARAAELALALDRGERPERYWDVALVHRDDAAGIAALDSLLDSPPGSVST